MPNPGEKIFLSDLEIDAESLGLIIDYFSHYDYNPPTILLETPPSMLVFKMLPSWDKDFINSINEEILIKLLYSCLKLEASPLFQLLCIVIASKFVDKNEIFKNYRVNLDDYDNPACNMYFKNKYSWAFSN